MTIANKLITQGYNRANAMVKAWALVKMPLVETKVAGVTYGNRQKAIERLSRYAPECVTIRLEQEQDNTYDRRTLWQYTRLWRAKEATVWVISKGAGGVCCASAGRRESGR